MKTLILYATKSGTTEYCAKMLEKQIDDCTISDISKEIPDISLFDTIIVGSGIRIGKIYKPIKIFLKENEELLLSKKFAFYTCNASANNDLPEIIAKNVSSKLAESAVVIESFGGKRPLSFTNDTSWLITKNMATFIKALKDKK